MIPKSGYRFSEKIMLHQDLSPDQERIMQDFGGWMWLIIDVGLVAILAGALIYGMGMWRKRHRDRATEQVRDEATERLYHKGQ
jgi:hypothetical protein